MPIQGQRLGLERVWVQALQQAPTKALVVARVLQQALPQSRVPALEQALVLARTRAPQAH